METTPTSVLDTANLDFQAQNNLLCDLIQKQDDSIRQQAKAIDELRLENGRLK